ncbi:hypothetical protein Sjap_009137 [Stephania japonica]|uniref:Uncharacterized protein n=1 Tax=Stephania japonica TaxID=461633 RepID=A0AAP0JSD3_9MAGN
MAKPLCSSESSSYSSPVPYVGLYIAGATLVCLLLMLSDMISSFRHRIRYLPCKLFSINSVSLFLLATASKLPVDLTTYMPSARDQLSKLSSTAMVCVSIGFLVPSFGINREAESITNLIALGLMVITIVVNVCIQMYTGVIFSFITEHIVILCCMILMLFVLKFSTSNVNSEKKIMVDTNRNLFKKNEPKSFIHQVKLWYMSSCITNPQYLLCSSSCLVVAVICIICLIFLSHAAFWSLVHPKLEFCKDVSDYGWSISIIVFTQIIFVLLGTLSTIFRCTMMLSLYSPGVPKPMNQIFEVEAFALNFLTKSREIMKIVSIIWLSRLLVKTTVTIINVLACLVLEIPFFIGLASIWFIALFMLSLCRPSSLITSKSDVLKVTSPWKEELKDHVASATHEFPERIMWICSKNMNKWMDASKRNPPNHLVQLLSQPRSDPPRTYVNMVQQIGIRASPDGYRLSCLSFVILERIISVSMPSTLTKSMKQASAEAFEMIYYIDDKINVGNYEDQRKHQLAKILWEYKGVHLSKKDSSSTCSSPSAASEAISLINNERRQFREGLVAREIDVIINFILMGEMEYRSIEELCFYL